MKVLQIYNNIPEMLKPCVDSVKRYAEREGAEYIVHDENPKGFQYKSIWADLIRMQYAAENKDLWYFDWDIFLDESFTSRIKEPVFFYRTPETCFYTGNDLSLFKKWLSAYQDMIDERGADKIKRGTLYHIVKHDRNSMKNFVKVKHLEYHRNNNSERMEVKK